MFEIAKDALEKKGNFFVAGGIISPGKLFQKPFRSLFDVALFPNLSHDSRSSFPCSERFLRQAGLDPGPAPLRDGPSRPPQQQLGAVGRLGVATKLLAGNCQSIAGGYEGWSLFDIVLPRRKLLVVLPVHFCLRYSIIRTRCSCCSNGNNSSSVRETARIRVPSANGSKTTKRAWPPSSKRRKTRILSSNFSAALIF